MKRYGYWLGSLALLGSLAPFCKGCLPQNPVADSAQLNAPSGWSLVGLRRDPPRGDVVVQVQFRHPARAEAYSALWECGARVVGRDYDHSTATVRIRRDQLAAIAALPEVRSVRLTRINAVR